MAGKRSRAPTIIRESLVSQSLPMVRFPNRTRTQSRGRLGTTRVTAWRGFVPEADLARLVVFALIQTKFSKHC